MLMKQLLLIVIRGKFQVKHWNIINFPNTWWIQTKHGSKRWLESFHLYLDSSISYKRNQKSVNLALCRKQATLVYEVMKRSLLLKSISSRTSEVKEFVKENKSQEISFQKDCILYYKGRILATEKINASCEMSTIMKDLCSNTFSVNTCDLQAFTSSIQYSKWNPPAFRCSKTFRCTNCMEIHFETWIHNAE